jgi:hypothetical protein
MRCLPLAAISLFSLSLLSLSLLSLVACSGAAAEDDEPTDDEGALKVGVYDADLAKALGRRTVEHDKGDFCVALKGIPGVTYTDDDIKKENKLCDFDFYKEAKASDEQKPAVLCPKVVSTNPGVTVFELPEGRAKADIQTDAICGDTSKTSPLEQLDKVGKYKQSLWCSHTGAIIGAYHVSRALGNIVGVPPAVLRTMDKNEHKKVVAQGGRITAAKYRESELIRRNWNALWPCLHDGRSDCGMPGTPSQNLYIRGPRLWDDDVELSNYQSGHLIGAFMGNASEDGNYPGLTTYDSLKSNAAYVGLTRAGLSFGKNFSKETVQGILAMKDVGDFLILDTIIEQQDRFSNGGGNMSKKDYLMWRTEDGGLQAERADKKKDAPGDAITVSRMVIEDNDCGLRRGMRAKYYDGLIQPIRHLAPATYRGLQDLAKNIDGQRQLFTNGMAMTDKEFDRVVENVKFVATTFQQKCASGQLELDLDAAAYLAGQPAPSCR